MSDAEKRPTAPAAWGRQLVDFVRQTRGEMSKVSWPSRDELVKATRMIVVLSIALGVAIGLLDWVLQKILVDGVAALVR